MEWASAPGTAALPAAWAKGHGTADSREAWARGPGIVDSQVRDLREMTNELVR